MSSIFSRAMLCSRVTPLAIRAAVERPVVEYGELAVGGRVHVELDHIGAGIEARAHRANGVLQIVVYRRQHSYGGAGIVLHIALIEALRHAAMGEQHWLAFAVRT